MLLGAQEAFGQIFSKVANVVFGLFAAVLKSLVKGAIPGFISPITDPADQDVGAGGQAKHAPKAVVGLALTHKSGPFHQTIDGSAIAKSLRARDDFGFQGA